MADSILLKRCPRCKETKPTTEFGVCRSRKDGLQSYCRECIARLMKRHRVPRGRGTHRVCADNPRIYSIWHGMVRRCTVVDDESYASYGARGITVCDEWLQSPRVFYEWSIAHGYEDGLTIDRIDPEKGYAPDNCRWATTSEQGSNRRKQTSSARGEYTSRFKGVSHRGCRWVAMLKRRYLGSFDTEVEAAMAYDSAASKEFGEFARLNFPRTEVTDVGPES